MASDTQQHHYQQIAAAISWISTHFRQQPSLEEMAAAVHMSPFHFQRLFTEWAGTSPKKFLQYISLQYAKQLLRQQQATLFDTAFQTGLSGTGRLHDLFVQIEGMTPATYQQGGSGLTIHYQQAATPFGPVLVANTDRGICYMAFFDDAATAVQQLQTLFPAARLEEAPHPLQTAALTVFEPKGTPSQPIRLHLKGTPFQLKVWETLLQIPTGRVTTYGAIAQQLQQAGAARAVGTAVGQNPVAYLIPCHRVIQASGQLGGYMWGPIRKTAILGWEQAQYPAFPDL